MTPTEYQAVSKTAKAEGWQSILMSEDDFHSLLPTRTIDEIIADIVLSVKGLAHTPKDDFLRSDWLAQIKDSNTVIGLADIEPGTIRVANGTTKDIQIASLL